MTRKQQMRLIRLHLTAAKMEMQMALSLIRETELTEPMIPSLLMMDTVIQRIVFLTQQLPKGV